MTERRSKIVLALWLAALGLGASSAACYGALGLGDFVFDADASIPDGGVDGASCIDTVKTCYACTPQTTPQFLNSCGPGGCIPFDRSRLDGLLLEDGGLPPLPRIEDGGTE
ncbi:hypothetical protein BH09MYX1_BH09MYX1_39710 [soil metagenome]